MEGKKKSSFSRKLLSLAVAIPSIYRLLGQFLLLLKYDAQLAKKSLIILFLLFLITGSLLTTMWLCLLGMLLIYFTSLQISWLVSLSILFILNLLILMIIGLSALVLKNKLTFPETRELLRHLHKIEF